jgi:hypothetical protein
MRLCRVGGRFPLRLMLDDYHYNQLSQGDGGGEREGEGWDCEWDYVRF